MITIYALGIPAYHELDELVFKYAIYDGEQLIDKKELYQDYRKPVLTGLYSIILLLKEIPEYKGQEVKIIVNDGALVEQISGTTTTRNRDVLKVAELCRKHLGKFSDTISVESVAGDHEATMEWEKRLEG